MSACDLTDLKKKSISSFYKFIRTLFQLGIVTGIFLIIAGAQQESRFYTAVHVFIQLISDINKKAYRLYV